MNRIAALLLIMTVATALYLVTVQYEHRHLFVELERATAEARSLATERSRLDAERRAQSASLRVAVMARDKLAMSTITPAITEYVLAPAAPMPAAAPQETP